MATLMRHASFLLLALGLLEWVIYVAAPTRLARLAVLPVRGVRDIVLTPEAIAVLSRAGDHAGGYRDGAATTLDLARGLPDGEIEQEGEAVCIPRLPQGFVLLKLRWVAGRTLGYARIDLTPAGDRVRVRASFVPMPVLLMIAAVGLCAVSVLRRLPYWESGQIAASTGIPFLVSVGAVVFGTLSARSRIEPAVAWAIGEIEARLQRAGRV
jgi:hypothetical protein